MKRGGEDIIEEEFRVRDVEEFKGSDKGLIGGGVRGFNLFTWGEGDGVPIREEEEVTEGFKEEGEGVIGVRVIILRQLEVESMGRAEE